MPVPAPDEAPPRTPPRNGRRGSANILAASVPPPTCRRGRGQKSMCRRNPPPATPAAPPRETQPACAGSGGPGPLRRGSPGPCRARFIFRATPHRSTPPCTLPLRHSRERGAPRAPEAGANGAGPPKRPWDERRQKDLRPVSARWVPKTGHWDMGSLPEDNTTGLLTGGVPTASPQDPKPRASTGGFGGAAALVEQLRRCRGSWTYA